MMTMMERSEAINRAQRALKALGEHPRSSQKELGHAREHLNPCYFHGDSDQVWDSVTKVEAMAERRLRRTERRGTTDRSGRDRRPRGACDSHPWPPCRGPCPSAGTGGRARGVEMQGSLTTRPRESLARSVDQWLVVKVGGGPRLVATAARPNRAPSPEHITGRATRARARGAGTLACVVPVGGWLSGTTSSSRRAVGRIREGRAREVMRRRPAWTKKRTKVIAKG
jgi:hypothetical protein